MEEIDRLGVGEENMIVVVHTDAKDRAEELAKTGIPVIIVAGGADDVVPYDENGELFVGRFRAAGGEIEEYVKPDCGHHPHSLEDPTPIVEFLVK